MFFHFFKILIFRVVRVVEGQKAVQNDTILSVMLHISKTIYVIIVIYRVFLKFFKILIFQVVRGGGKRVKNGPKWQKILCVALDISRAIHHMIVIYGFFHFFKNLITQVARGEGWGRVKNVPKWQKNSVRRVRYLRNHTSYDCHLCYTCVKW